MIAWGKAGGKRGKSVASVLFPLAFSFLIFPALAARPTPAERWTILLSGDADGYLSPCGCTSPMQGGLKRRVTALRSADPHVVRLDNGGLLGGVDRQNVLKAETAAQSMAESKIDAVNLNAGDARMGESTVLTLANLSGHRLVSTSLRPSTTLLVDAWREAGPFLIGGTTVRPQALASGLREASADSPVMAAERLVAEAQGRGLAPILLFDGDRDAARALARAVPALRLVTYRFSGRPPSKLDAEGPCALATPGEHGKAVVRLAWQDDAFVGTTVQMLGPEVRDDVEAKALYGRYLKRVTAERLLDDLHPDAKGFAGSARCLPCHQQAARVWAASSHHGALATLEHEGHGRDPECVPCHVVGTAQGSLRLPKRAFDSRETTPALANVGCESCHGAGASHAAAPHRFTLPRVGSASCRPCHTLDNSPNFDFEKYWPRIRH